VGSCAHPQLATPQGQARFAYTANDRHSTADLVTQALHSQARTTHLFLHEIKNPKLPQAELARRYNVTRQRVRKGPVRETPLDGSHCPERMNITLPPEQELIVIEPRKTFLLAIDDLLLVTLEFINPAACCAGPARCLRPSRRLGLARPHSCFGGRTIRDRAPAYSAEPSTNQRHDRALQWPHQVNRWTESFGPLPSSNRHCATASMSTLTPSRSAPSIINGDPGTRKVARQKG